MKIEVEFDLNDYLARHRGYDEDGDPVSEPLTLEAVVIGEAARSVAAQVEKAEVRKLHEMVHAALLDEIEHRIAAVVDVALSEGVQWTPPGKYVAETRPLDELVREQVATVLAEKRSRNYGEGSKTLIADLVEKTITSRVQVELRNALDEGREAVKKALRQEGAKLIEEAISRMARSGA